MTHLYGTDDYPEAKTIDVVLCRLRKRLGRTVWPRRSKASGGSPTS
jgi:hypothetical protein